MNICFLSHAAVLHTYPWIRYFRDRGHRVSLVSLTPGKPEPGIDMYNLHGKQQISHSKTNWHYLLRLPEMWRIVRKVKPEILNAHFLSSYGVLGAVIRPARCPFIISLHGSDILTIPRRSLIHDRAARFALRRSHMITSVSPHMTELLSDYISPGKHVLTLQYGVDTDLFFPPPASTERKPVCLSNRKMIPLSNLEVLLQAARILNRQESPLRIDFANDGEVMPILKQEASRKQLDRTVFFLGPVDHTVMPDLLRSASIYVSMSLSDGASLSLMEAMACGTFPVLSDIAANREWITDGLNGYLIPPDSPEQLAGKLNAAWNHRELREKAAKYNRSLILEKGDRKKNMKVIERAFIQLVERSRESSL